MSALTALLKIIGGRLRARPEAALELAARLCYCRKAGKVKSDAFLSFLQPQASSVSSALRASPLTLAVVSSISPQPRNVSSVLSSCSLLCTSETGAMCPLPFTADTNYSAQYTTWVLLKLYVDQTNMTRSATEVQMKKKVSPPDNNTDIPSRDGEQHLHFVDLCLSGKLFWEWTCGDTRCMKTQIPGSSSSWARKCLKEDRSGWVAHCSKTRQPFRWYAAVQLRGLHLFQQSPMTRSNQRTTTGL